MERYQGLKNICSIWMMLTVISAGFAAVFGGITLVRGNLFGLAYIIGAIIGVLFAQTLDYIIALLIDIAVSLQRPIDKPVPDAPPSAIRKLPKG